MSGSEWKDVVLEASHLSPGHFWNPTFFRGRLLAGHGAYCRLEAYRAYQPPASSHRAPHRPILLKLPAPHLINSTRASDVRRVQRDQSTRGQGVSSFQHPTNHSSTVCRRATAFCAPGLPTFELNPPATAIHLHRSLPGPPSCCAATLPPPWRAAAASRRPRRWPPSTRLPLPGPTN